MRITDVPIDDIRDDTPWKGVYARARLIGLEADLTEREAYGSPLYGITVSRTGNDWSMNPKEIAIGRSVEDVSDKAFSALQRMAPQIQAKLDAAGPEAGDPREERIAVALERIADALESMVADDD